MITRRTAASAVSSRPRFPRLVRRLQHRQRLRHPVRSRCGPGDLPEYLFLPPERRDSGVGHAIPAAGAGGGYPPRGVRSVRYPPGRGRGCLQPRNDNRSRECATSQNLSACPGGSGCGCRCRCRCSTHLVPLTLSLRSGPLPGSLPHVPRRLPPGLRRGRWRRRHGHASGGNPRIRQLPSAPGCVYPAAGPTIRHARPGHHHI